MDWEYMEAHTEQLDRYLHALYYIGSYQPPEKEAEIAKITRKLSSAQPRTKHGHALRSSLSSSTNATTVVNNPLVPALAQRTKTSITLPPVTHSASMPAVENRSPRYSTRTSKHTFSTSVPETVCESCSKTFMTLKTDLRKTSTRAITLKEENEQFKKLTETLSSDLKSEIKRSEQLKKLLEEKNIPVPEHLQFGKDLKKIKSMKKSGSSKEVSKGEDPLSDLWASIQEKSIIKYQSTESGEHFDRILSQMNPTMDIARPGRLILQESACVVLDCDSNGEYSKAALALPPNRMPLFRIYLFSDALLLVRQVAKRKIRPEAWMQLSNTRLESDPDNIRKRSMFKIICQDQSLIIAVFFNDRNNAKQWLQDIRKQSKFHLKSAIFGVPLGRIPIKEDEKIGILPAVLCQLVEHLREHSMKAEGLFRLAGSRSVTEDIRDLFDQGMEVNLASYDDHSIGDVLKQWFRELPTSVVPYSVYDALHESLGKGEENLMNELPSILEQIPELELRILRYTINFLNEVSKFSETNMMTEENLGTCFAPNLLRPRSSFKSSYEPLACNQIISTIIAKPEIIPKESAVKKATSSRVASLPNPLPESPTPNATPFDSSERSYSVPALNTEVAREVTAIKSKRRMSRRSTKSKLPTNLIEKDKGDS